MANEKTIQTNLISSFPNVRNRPQQKTKPAPSPLISRDEKGRAYIAGKTMRVSQIAIDANAGDTPEQIAGNYPHISLSQVYAALAYYHADRAEVDAEIEAADAFVEALMKADVPRVTLATLEERRRVIEQAA